MPLKILKASAGSGKTFQLTRHYLQLCLQQSNPLFFQHILAITFTNKATQEMKEKILEACRVLAREPDKSDHLEYFVKELNLPPKEISARAGRILEAIIYNYGRFSISTIDRFFQRVLRAFAREIKIDDAFEIKLDIQKVLSVAIDEMIDQLDDKHDATAGIRSMIDDRIKDQKNWKFDEDLVEFGQELFKEGLIADQPLKVVELIKIKNKLRQLINELDEQLGKFKAQAVEAMRAHDLTEIDFPYKSGSFAATFTNPKNLFSDLSDKTRFMSAADSIDPLEWMAKTTAKDIKERIESIFPILQPILKAAKDLVTSKEYDYNTAKATLGNFDKFILLAAIQKAVKEYTKQENIFVLANTQPLLKDVITSEKAPFLYEKIGSLYKYYLIDEFQDTSKLQYENLIPLLEESMSQQQYGESLVVGDTKQAIYRWRGGDWALLEEQVALDFPYSSNDQLTSNFRSFTEIIDFNNAFYQRLTHYISHVLDSKIEVEPDSPIERKKKIVSDIFQQAAQKLGNEKKKGGYVEIIRVNKLEDEKLNKDHFQTLCLELLKEKILDLNRLGFNGRDICILFRNNAEGNAIAEFLSTEQKGPDRSLFQFQSEESLYLKNCYSVIATIQFFTLLVSPDHYIARLNLWQMFYLMDILEKPNYQLVAEDDFYEKFYPALLPLFQMTETSDIIQMTQLFWAATKINTNSNDRAYLSLLQDTMIDFSRSQGNDISGFLEFYYDNADSLKIKGDPTAHGIQLMTIHQSKGLEFEVVIIPFASWNLKMNDRIWVDGRLSPIPIQSSIPIKLKKDLIKSHYCTSYYEEMIRNYIDQINLLYVATTRAIQQLYMFVRPDGSKDDASATISDFILNSINIEEAKEDEQFSYFRSGNAQQVHIETQAPETTRELISPHFNIRTELPSIKEGIYPEALELEGALGSDRSSVSKGYIIHQIFELIEDSTEVSFAITKLIQEGLLMEGERAYFNTLIDQILMDQQIVPWFDKANKIIIERDILLPGGEVYRPDRILCLENETWILDFKSGSRSSQHHKQVYNYVLLLAKMGYPNVKGFIYYTTEAQLVAI